MVASYRDKPSADAFERLLAHLGGPQALRDDPNDFRKAVERLYDARESLIEKHPNKWVSMGKDGVVSIGKRSKRSFRTLRQRASARPTCSLNFLTLSRRR